MGRAPNPGGGQRVSAHVVPKGKPFPDSEEEERTTIESQWEEEASTTVEQGDVADKIRSLVEPAAPRLGLSNITSTGSGALDEPTVDDQHASALSPARLVITQGNDVGHAFEMQPGKTYTIGRAIDNDVVLTDIAVSRKHFDLRHEDGAWVIVDRGSGNGTVVNGTIEDNAFMLANGDVIEIGNTVFRFDHPESGARPPVGFDDDVDVDDEELSTVAGKPVRTDPVELATPPTRGGVARERPKTLPPPAPVRHAASQPPPGMMPYGQHMPQPASTLPLPQMANRAPVLSPHAPTMLGEQRQPLPGMMPTTIPGQGAPQRQMFGGYPQAQAQEIPPHSIHQLMIQSQNPRGDASTAHVSPIPYDMMPPVSRGYTAPQLTKRTKMIIGATGGALLVAIATVAIIKSGSGTAKASAKTNAAAAGSASGAPTVESIKLPPGKPDLPAAGPSGAAMVRAVGTGATTPTTTTGSAGSAATSANTAKTDKSAATTATSANTAKTDKIAATTATSANTAKTDKSAATTASSTSSTSSTTAKNDRSNKSDKGSHNRNNRDRQQTTTRTEPRTDTTTATTTTTAHTDRPDRSTRPQTTTASSSSSSSSSSTSSSSSSSNKRVAVADSGEARSKADGLYKSHKFAEASSVLASAAKAAEEPEAGKLRYLANIYSELGKAYTIGMAPAAKAADAFTQLRYAANFDRAAGGALDGDIQGRLSEIAPKAAVAFVAAKDFKSAHTAVLTAESLGRSDGNVAAVKRILESRASEMYDQAKSEMSSNPAAAKDKLRKIQEMVDAKSPTYQKAAQLLKS